MATVNRQLESSVGGDAVMQEIGELKAEVSGLRAEVGGLRDLLSEAVISQQRDHGKRIREQDERLTKLEIAQAAEQGKSVGSKTTLALIFSIVTGVSGFVGALISRML